MRVLQFKAIASNTLLFITGSTHGNFRRDFYQSTQNHPIGHPRVIVFAIICLSLVTLASCSTKLPSGSYKTDGFWYTFKSGDTLEKVSSQFKVSRIELQRVNEIYDPDDLSEGMELFIPRKKTAKSTLPSTQPNTQATSRMIWPAAGTISSGFGKRHGRYHQGIDITKDNGRDIKAAADGVITFVGVKSGYGNTVIIDHGSSIKTLYAHNAKIYVKKNQRVKQGKVISLMGSSGKSTGIHLHFEVRVKGKPQNPLRYLPIR